LLQSHLSEAEAFSKRLQGASNSLAQHESSGAINDIVMALIDDNRQMRDSLSDLRNQLEDAAFRFCVCSTTLSVRKRPACATW
jgi:hypothetical protein